jgi:hypothetical protein
MPTCTEGSGQGRERSVLGWAFGEKNFRERDGLASQKVLNQTFLKFELEGKFL